MKEEREIHSYSSMQRSHSWRTEPGFKLTASTESPCFPRPHLEDEVADFIWVGGPGSVYGGGDEGWCHVVAENHLRPGLESPVELGDVIVLNENKRDQ